jgi:hypothetical protein
MQKLLHAQRFSIRILTDYGMGVEVERRGKQRAAPMMTST